MALVLTLATSCSGGGNSNALSADEASEEAMGVMGKGTDVSMKGISDPDGLKGARIEKCQNRRADPIVDPARRRGTAHCGENRRRCVSLRTVSASSFVG